MNVEQLTALTDLIALAAQERVITEKRQRALIQAQMLGVSWGDLGIALGCSRETARGRVKAAKRDIEEIDAAGATTQPATPPTPVEAQPAVNQSASNGTMPTAVH